MRLTVIWKDTSQNDDGWQRKAETLEVDLIDVSNGILSIIVDQGEINNPGGRARITRYVPLANIHEFSTSESFANGRRVKSGF